MRVVLDTHRVISALLFPRGLLGWLPPPWTSGAIVPLISSDTVRELIRVLAYPTFALDADDVQAVLADYVPFTDTVNVTEDACAASPRCTDPDDQMFIGLALPGGAEVLVSGDAALLEMAGQVPFQVESPAAFRRRFA